MTMTTTETLQIGPSNPDGKKFGLSASDPIGFFGATPQVQPSGALQSAIPQGASGYGNAGGQVTIYTSSQSPTGIATITSAEQSLTVTGVLSTDLVFYNKPTAQAGLALCMGRVSAANTVKLSLGNSTGSTITPTGSESWIIGTIAANLQVTATLSPAAVAANSVSEQTFTLSGAAAGALQSGAGQLVWANKPTQQAGLGLMSARISGNNQVALTFANFTAATITPTASEAYIFGALTGVVAVSNIINFGISIGSPAGVATITTAERAATEAGLAATDLVVGISKPTLQAGLGVCSGRISAASTLQVTFVNPTAATVTPTASEVYAVTVYRPSPGALLSVFSVTITPASVAASTTAEQTFAVTGITSGQPVWAEPQGQLNSTGAIAFAGVRASATNQIGIVFANLSASAVTPPSLTWLVAQVNQTTPTAGNFVALSVLPANNQVENLVNAMRSAHVGLGLIAGA
jgi:hypothetical protein